jgi:site-specific DNA recombinase
MSKAAKPQVVRAVGYIRVSTEQQSNEGVSMEAQRIKLAAHCTAQDIQLLEIIADEGVSAKSLDRPGLQRALKMLRNGQADALVVVKLDRLTRSVKDLGFLCENYFSDGRPWSLLSVTDSIDTRSASGKLILNVLTSVAQWEREAISDRTREAMQHLKSQGVVLGAAPYGWKHTEELDAGGRRKLVENPAEQAGIKRVCELYEQDLYIWQICEMLDAEKVPIRGTAWHRRTVYRILHRAGFIDAEDRPRKSEPSRKQKDAKRPKMIVRDKESAAQRALVLREDGRSLRWIADRLVKEGFLPPRGDVWHAASILDLLRSCGRKSAA